MNILHWFYKPNLPDINPENFKNVQIDALGVGLANAAAPFLPVFLTRLGASYFQVGLLTSIPALTGLVLSILAGNFLQTRRNIVPWYSITRAMYIAAYAITGLVILFVPVQTAVIAILVVWALASIPQVILSITFSVIMNQVAGPNGRYELMSRRWSLIGLTTSIGIVLAGYILNKLVFPLNYQLVFIGLSLGGVVAYFACSRIKLPPSIASVASEASSIVPSEGRLTLRFRFKSYTAQFQREKKFLSVLARQLVYQTGASMAIPLFPLYYVRVVHASDAWIGVINTAQTVVLIGGYLFWSHQSRKRGSRPILLLTTLGLTLFTVLVALTQHVVWIAIYAGITGIFQAGLDLVFFDDLMQTMPASACASFVSFSQTAQYASTIAAPIMGSLLADQIGISGALIVSAAIRLGSFVWFAMSKKTLKNQTTAAPTSGYAQ